MPEHGAYGERFGGYLRVPHAPFLLARTMRQAEIAVTEVRADDPPHEKSGAMPAEDAFIIALHLRDFPNEKLWEDGRLTRSAPLMAGTTAMIDLKREPVFMMSAPFHSLHAYLPRAALNAIAEETNAAPVRELRYAPGNSVEDPVVRALFTALQPALERPAEANDLFVSAILLALATHVGETYGGMQRLHRDRSGGLMPWQRRRAEAALRERIDGRIVIAELARECGLSASHFARAFRRSFGVAPHQWLLRQRIARARELLAGTPMPLAEIAIACGFADQSHMTRVFSQHVGVGPAAWRRMMKD